MKDRLAFARRPLPPFATVSQRVETGRLGDPRAEARERLRAALEGHIRRGERIAITAGSRGMGDFVPILSGCVDALRALGASPFVIAAMGSHGGAAPEGQIEVLRRLGVTEEAVGAKVEASLETVVVGRARNGAGAHLQKLVADADGVVVLGRVATHPETADALASGLLKMATIGLGSRSGAQEAHTHGLWESIREVPRVVLATGKIRCGVAVVENGRREAALLEAVPAAYEAFREADERLLREARRRTPGIPFDALDVLVVDALGKDVSGTGMDTHVIGRSLPPGAAPGPAIARIVVLSLTPASLGNGNGIGMADFTTRRFERSFDPGACWVNVLTATEPGGDAHKGNLPLALESDRGAMETALFSALAGAKPRLCRIRDTRTLDTLAVSESLVPEAEARGLAVLAHPAPLPFDSQGNLF